ncbi:MAG: nicotinic acid mononucleotide adenylyltransferase, partial [Firmicutes bacterium]|nr:nicotinic acid mononucleotide adenylyltransferase [Bacillota bacterium]
SYTIETVRYYREIFGKDVDLFFITGADAILEIPAWAEFKELLETCTFIAASRPGYSLEKLYERLAPHYPHVRKRVHLLENPAMAVSSTFIRERVRSGKTVKYLTTGSVENYIYKYGLYRGKNIDRKVYFTS